MITAMALSVAAVGLFAALLLGISNLTLRAAMAEEGYLPAATDYVSLPPPPPTVQHDRNMTVIDVTGYTRRSWFNQENPVDVDVPVLPTPDAAAIGAQYIYEIFDVCIDGMYVELTFEAATPWMGRSVWRGEVSPTYRGTRAFWENQERIMQERMRELEEVREAREYDDWDDLERPVLDVNVVEPSSWSINFPAPAQFIFVIDALTGEWIDVFDNRSFIASQWIDRSDINPFEEFVEREFGGSWDAAMRADINNETMAELYAMAELFGQKQFVNTAVVSVELEGSFRNLRMDESRNVYLTPGGASFNVTDETGRVAVLVICLENMSVLQISTSLNDFIFPDGNIMERGGWTFHPIDDQNRIVYAYVDPYPPYLP